MRNLGLAVYGPRRGRAANRHLARGPELNTGPQPVVPGSPFGSTPAETFVRVGPRVRIRFPPAERLSLGIRLSILISSGFPRVCGPGRAAQAINKFRD